MSIWAEMKTRTRRRDDLVLRQKVTASYTLDRNYVQSYTLNWGDSETDRLFQPFGSVLAMNPANRKVVPNYTSYGFGVIGVLLEDVDCQWAETQVDVLFEGVVNEKAVWDNGIYQGLLQATRDSLADRISFVDADDELDIRGAARREPT